MRYSLFTCALLFGFFITTAKAQKQTLGVDHDLNHVNAKSPENIIRCYTMEMDEQRRNKHPELPSLKEEENLFQEQLENYKKGKGQNMNKATLLTIPCIFHIITDGAGAENISAAQVQAQVDQLNIDFRNLAGSTDPAAADVEIEFCLAILDENDNLLPEQGINRVTDYGEGPFNTGFIDGTIKPGTIWNPDEYMNVWVADITGGILGYAQFPSNSGLGGLNANGGAATTDGVVHLYSTIGSVANPFPGGAPYNLGRTMTHEVGHWLGLRHIWGDANCGNDFCGDTPQSQTSNFGCPNLTTCDGNQDMVENYMDYTNDACMDIFTADQKDRIRTVMDICPRRALLPLSEKCGLPQPTISFVNTNGGTINEGENCDYVDITVDMQISLPPTDDATVTFTLGGNTTAIEGVDFNIIPNSAIFLANVSDNESIIIRIYNDAILENSEIIELQIVVTTAGDAVASLVSGTYTLTILDANFVASNILYEDFEAGGLGAFTTQGAATSDLFQNGNTANASSQFWIIEPSNVTQFAYTNDDACDCDKSNDLLTSPVFSLAGLTGNIFLEFDHAFSAETYETAEVEINTGAGWNNLMTLANTSVNNNNTLTTPWVIGNQTLLTPFVGSNNVQIRFTYNDGGNWAYGLAIDNIRVYTDAPVASNNLSGTDTQASCGPFTWIDGNTYAASNNTATYTIVGGAANGCDSLVTLDLTISNTVNGTDTQASCGPFTWIDGNTYAASNNTATYTIVGGAANGCDSLVTLDLTISNTVNGTDTQASCGPFTWIDGNTYSASNNTATYTILGGAANGCDSLVTLDLTISNTVNGTDTQASCGPFTWIDGNTYAASNNTATYTIVGGAANGCDSLVTLDLTISNTVNGTDTQASCGPFTWIDGNTYSASNNTATYTIVGGAANGCDSLVTLGLTISNTVNGTDTQASCGPFTWIDGNTYAASNNTATYTIVGGAANGCDSLVTLDLTISNTVNGTDTQASCGPFTWIDGNTYAASNNTATYTIVGGAANGCDSLVTLDLTISNTVNGTDTQASCGPFTWIDGNTYAASNNTATYTIVGGASNGCDSLVTLDLTISNTVNGTDTQASCGPFTWIDGNTYTASNNTATYTIVGGAANGCDSLVTLDLTISNTVNGTDTQASCGPFTWIDGNTYSASNNTATYTIVGGAANGCDSLVTLDLTLFSSNSTIFTETFDSGTIAGANAPVLYGNGGSDFNPNYALSGTFFGWFNVQNGIGDVDIYEQNFTGLQIGCTVSVAVWMRSTIPVSDVTMTLSDDNGTILSVLDPILSGAWQLVTISATVTSSGLNFLVHFNSTGGNGLDVIMEDLIVTQSCGIDAVIAPVSDQCLNGNSFTFDGMNSLSSAGIISYVWDLGDNSPSLNTPSTIYSYANPGTYDVSLSVSDGVCIDDTTIQLNVYAEPIIDNPSDVISCDTYVLPTLSSGSYYTGSSGSGIQLNEGVILDITQNVFVYEATNTVPSCSNENEFIVTIDNTITTTDFETSCGPFTWIDGITYNESNSTAVFTYPNATASGCDSVVFLNLTVASLASGTDVLSSCTPITWIDGNTYTSSNNTATYTIIGGAANGCDSTVNLDLTISNAVYGTDIQVACETFTWIDGIIYTSSNNTATYTYPNGAAAGCDSIVTLDLTINNSISFVDVHETCDNFTWIDGITYNESNSTASFIYPGGAVSGCDSIVYLSLTINNTSYGTDFQTSCNEFTWIDGNTYTASNNTASYTFTGGSSTGCDSIVSLNLTIYNNVNFTDIQSACESYTWIDGNTYTENNSTATYTFIGGTSNGCDSVVNLNLTINNLTTLNPGYDLSLCEGDEFTPNATGALNYSWNGGLVNGSTFTPEVGVTEYTVIGTDLNNCTASASIFVSTTSLPSIDLTSSDPICAGDPSGSITISVSEGTPPYSIEWGNNENTFNLENIIAGSYDAIVTDDADCQITISETISNPLEPCYELPETFLYVPNTFTPDADEHNQNWFIILSGVDPLSFSLRIYNRWGEIIWESFDMDAKWDGTYRNLDVPEGTYTWQLEYQRLSETKKYIETGHINLLR